MELFAVSTIALILFVGLTTGCPDLCVCDKRKEKLTCKNVKLTPEYLLKLVIPPSIKEIYFTDNGLAKITPDILRPFRQATKLEISRNLIEDIPPFTFQEFQNLTKLKLNNNKIREINRDAFTGLRKLVSLEIVSNKLTDLYAGMFDRTQSITSIKLMDNKIQEIPNGVFSRLPSLNFLFIHENEIASIGDKAFQNMTMERIDLTNNRIKRLSRSTFLNFKIKFKISLLYNPLQCDCKDVMTYARDFKGMQKYIWGDCSSPANLKGKNIVRAYLDTDCTLCDLNLCQNGGSCEGNRTSFSCMCLDQFRGSMCERSICKPEIRYVEKVVQLPSSTVLKYVDKDDGDAKNNALLEKKNNELETKLMILYAICSLELVIILCFVGLLIMGKYQDWRLMKKYNKQNSPHILEKFRNHDPDNPSGKGYISISELIPYSY